MGLRDHIPPPAIMGGCHWVQLEDGMFLNVYQTIDGGQWVQRASQYEEIDDWRIDIDDMKAVFVNVSGVKTEYRIINFGQRESE